MVRVPYLAFELPGIPGLAQQGSKALHQHRLAAAVVLRQQEEVPERQHPTQRLRTACKQSQAGRKCLHHCGLASMLLWPPLCLFGHFLLQSVSV